MENMGEQDEKQGMTYRETKPFTRLMIIELPGDEIRSLKDRLPDLQGELDAKELEKSRAVKEFDRQIKGIRNSIAVTAREIRDGKGERSIKCVWRFFDALGKKFLVRGDTGEEFGEEFMNDHERQRSLPGLGERVGDLEEPPSGENMTETDEKARTAYTEEPRQFNAPRITVADRPKYEPLREPLGSCDLCGGFGVLPAVELFGEPTTPPCTCEAGRKVEEIAAGVSDVHPCEVCDDEHRRQVGDCKTCPDYPGEKEESREGLIKGWQVCQTFAQARGWTPDLIETAAGIEEKLDTIVAGEGTSLTAIRIAEMGTIEEPLPETSDPEDIPPFNTDEPETGTTEAEPVEPQASPEESGEGERKGADVQDDQATEPVVEEVMTGATLTPLQTKCPHPKPFRKIIPGRGEVCGVCDLTLEPEAPTPPPAKETAAPTFEVIPPEKDRSCCMPDDRDVAMVGDTRVMFCRFCRLVIKKEDTSGPKFESITFVVGERFPGEVTKKPNPLAGNFAKPGDCDHPQARQMINGENVECGKCGTVLRKVGDAPGADPKKRGGKAK